jgi:hypothetical protein
VARVQLESASWHAPGTVAARLADGPSGPTRATVFGLDVRADCPISFLEGARAAPTGRTLELSVAEAPASADWPAGSADWPAGSAERPAGSAERPAGSAEIDLLCDQRNAGGAMGFQIEAHPLAGYRIWGPAHGTHLLSSDGRRLTSFPSDTDMGWQRLLVAQALPFAAALHGLEVFHAGAVLLEGAAIAFAGPCGSGKSSTVGELCREGADFMTDDAIALERSGAELLAHPGTPLASLDRNAARAREEPPGQEQEGYSPQEVVAGDARELMVRMPGAAQTAPLRALFFLDPRRDGPSRPRFEPSGDPRALLTATFNFVLGSPDRLQRLLDVCALLAGRRVERIVFGRGADPSVLAAAVRERLGAET